MLSPLLVLILIRIVAGVAIMLTIALLDYYQCNQINIINKLMKQPQYPMPKPPRQKKQHLKIQIAQPTIHSDKKSTKNNGNRYSKQILLREKHHIQEMENQVNKLTQRIESQKKMLRNRILIQELQHDIRRNQIASQMSKKEIIMNKLAIIKGQKPPHQQSPLKTNPNCKSPQKYQVSIKEATHNPQNKSQLPKIRCKSNQSMLKLSIIRQSSLQQLKSRTKKQKQYGDRVQKQYSSNRAKSAFTYLQIQKQAKTRKTKLQQQRNRILEQLKKPSIPIKISQLDRKKQIDRIRKSQHSSDTKLKLLNYLSEVEVNRLRLKEVKGKHDDLDLLGYINSARTDILLDNY